MKKLFLMFGIFIVCIIGMIVSLEMSNKYDEINLTNLKYLEKENYVELIKYNEAKGIVEGYNSTSEQLDNKNFDDYISEIAKNNIDENIEFYKIIYKFNFADCEELEGQTEALAIVLYDEDDKRIENIINLNTSVYSEKSNIRWVDGSSSSEINFNRSEATIFSSGYVEIKLKRWIELTNVSNAISIRYNFKLS